MRIQSSITQRLRFEESFAYIGDCYSRGTLTTSVIHERVLDVEKRCVEKDIPATKPRFRMFSNHSLLIPTNISIASPTTMLSENFESSFCFLSGTLLFRWSFDVVL